MLDNAVWDELGIDYLLLEHIPAIVYISARDTNSSSIYTSPQIETLLGFSRSDWHADHTLWRKQIHPDDRSFVLAEMDRVRVSDQPCVCEYRILTRDGSVRWFRDNSAVLHVANHQRRYLYKVLLDITEQKRLEEELAKAQLQLEEIHRPQLDEREIAVLRLIHARYTDYEIGRELAICERTVRNCVKSICTKLGVEKRAEALREALQRKLIGN
jgi:PAS domain S-box-containing protein